MSSPQWHFPPIFQHPADLVLGVTFGEYSNPGLTVLAQRAVKAGGVTLDLHIIGESHWVRVHHDGVTVLDEILGCTVLNPAACHILHPFSKVTAFAAQRAGYSTVVTFADAPRADWPPFPEDDLLALDFPPLDADGHTPITRIGWQITATRLRWWTLHTYPHEDRLTHVYSQSTWTLEP